MTIFREEVVKRLTRPSRWFRERERYLEKYGECACCGAVKGLEVHHILPVIKYPVLEFKHTNLITLCREHHFSFGHLCNWDSWNIEVETICRYYRRLYMEKP